MAIPAPWRREEGVSGCTIHLEKRAGEGLRSNSVVYRVFTSVTMRPFLCLVLLEWTKWLGGSVSPLGLLRLSLTREMRWMAWERGYAATIQYGTAVKSTVNLNSLSISTS
jgi:hypothetical protein